MTDNQLKPTQAARDAAADAFPAVHEDMREAIRFGLHDDSEPVQAFARFEQETLSREQSRDVGREALQAAEFGLSEMIRLSEMGIEASLREPEEHGNFAAFNRAKEALDKVRAALSPASPEQPSPPEPCCGEYIAGSRCPACPDRVTMAEQPSPSPVTGEAVEQGGATLAPGLERAAQWHDARCKGPDVFEQELHENSAKALRHLAANPDATDMQALEAALTTDQSQTDRLREAFASGVFSVVAGGGRLPYLKVTFPGLKHAYRAEEALRAALSETRP